MKDEEPSIISLWEWCKREGKQKGNERQVSEENEGSRAFIAFLLIPSSFTWCGYLIELTTRYLVLILIKYTHHTIQS